MRIRVLTRAVVVAAAVLVPAQAAEAASALQIYRVYYDSPGADRGGNASLNAEWVQIKNKSKTTRSLTGWKLRDKNGFVYVFPTTKLKPGATVKVHSGKGKNKTGRRYWQRAWYVWNNTGDTATLKNKAGKTIDSCTFPGSADSKYC